MAVNEWLGAAPLIAQTGTITVGGTYADGQTYTVGIPTVSSPSNTVAYTSVSGDTNAKVQIALLALLQAAASEIPQFQELTFSSGGTLVINFAAVTPGNPVTVSSSASGTGTLVTATVVANSSPNDLTNVLNWSTGSLPANNDTVNFDTGSVVAMWNADALSAVTGLTVNRREAYTGGWGLPDYNPNGYPEYRKTEFTIAGGTINFEQPITDQPLQFRLNTGSGNTTLNIKGEGAATLQSECLGFRGTGTNTCKISNASLAVGINNNQAATLGTITATNSTVRCGGNVTLTTLNNYNSTCEINNAFTTLNAVGTQSITNVKGAATVTNVYLSNGAKLVWMSTGTISGSSNVIGVNCTVDFETYAASRTVSNPWLMQSGASLLDGSATVTWSAAVFTLGTAVDLDKVTVRIGTKSAGAGWAITIA